MAPPSFGDLGKNANDLLSKDFSLGAVKAEVKGRTTSGVELKTSAGHKIEDGSVSGELETKWSIKEHGLTITEKWRSNNLLVAELALEDKLVRGLKTSLEASFQPNSGKKSAKWKNSWKNAMVNSALDLDFNGALPVASASAVVQHNEFLAGASLGFDVEQQRMTKLGYSIAYQLEDFQLFGGVENGTNFSGSAYHQVNRLLETGAKFSWASNTHLTSFAVAAKYKLQGDSYVKVKADNASALVAAYSFKPNAATRVSLCASIDGKSISGGRHQLGAAITFEQ